MMMKLLNLHELQAQLDDLQRVRRESVAAGDTPAMIEALDFLIVETAALVAAGAPKATPTTSLLPQ